MKRLTHHSGISGPDWQTNELFSTAVVVMLCFFFTVVPHAHASPGHRHAAVLHVTFAGVPSVEMAARGILDAGVSGLSFHLPQILRRVHKEVDSLCLLWHVVSTATHHHFHTAISLKQVTFPNIALSPSLIVNMKLYCFSYDFFILRESQTTNKFL